MLVQAKSLLAKLLASENITVEHRNTQTAYFDTKNRVMTLPAWKEMSPALYDLLLGHETGHALYTPPQGWHDKVTDKTRKGFKTFLNVVEDVRIEKRIQEKFPGLKVSFRKGYSELMERDFFGVDRLGLKILTLPLIDRINLHYQIGSHLNIQFSDDEQIYIDHLDAMKTWDDVVRMAELLYQNGKDEMREELENGMQDFREAGDEDFDDFEWDEDWDDTNKKSAKGDRGGINNIDDEDLDPESITDRNFRKRESELLDDKVKPFFYADCPTPNLKNIIVPYKNLKQFQNDFRSQYNDEDIDQDKIESAKNKMYAKFTESNKRYISYLIKEFEMRRNARQFARASVSKTGELDMKKVHQFKLNDDLFKRMTVVPKGKSHGLVMFVDYSGSMQENILPTIEQTLVLATFCKKVNIPFRVFAFTDYLNPAETMCEELGWDLKEYLRHTAGVSISYEEISSTSKFNKFSKNDGELDFGSNTFRLREYLSSEMSSVEFKNASKHWLLVGELFLRRTYRGRYNMDLNLLPAHYLNGHFEYLNGTPLNETIAASIAITTEFKKKYKLDVVNTVFLTDGDANDTNSVVGGRGLPGSRHTDANIVIRDKETKLQGVAIPGQTVTYALLNLLRVKADVNVIGFFLIPSHSAKKTIQTVIEKSKAKVLDFDKQYAFYKKEKFFMLNDVGYDDFYLIPGDKDLSIEDESMVVSKDASNNELKRAFMKMQKTKVVNRVLLTRFAEKIA